jgi:hypothetical protein
MKQQMLEAEVKELRVRIEALTAERDALKVQNEYQEQMIRQADDRGDYWKTSSEKAEADTDAAEAYNTRLLGLIYDVVCGRGMFGLSADDDLKWAMQHLGSALTGKETK